MNSLHRPISNIINHFFDRLQRSNSFMVCVACVIALLAAVAVPVAIAAQTNGNQPQHVRITAVSSERAPEISLRLTGFDSSGQPIDFTRPDLRLLHNEQMATDVQIIGQQTVGTLTLFLLDTPSGVDAETPALATALSEYASTANMQEQIDYVAVYEVGLAGAAELVAAEPFYNSITNFLFDPIELQTGPTALIDSTASLISQIDQIRAQPEQPVHIVIFSDGTDVVSTQFTADQLPGLAQDAGIILHTVLLNNENLSNPEQGTTYMQSLAAATGGRTGTLADTNSITAIWQAIAAFRNQILVSYQGAITAGDNAISISFSENADVRSTATVTVDPATMMLTLDIPPNSRNLTIADFGQPISLALPASASWLDGTVREITQVQLWVNDIQVADVDPAELSRFEVEIPNLSVGENRFWLTAVDAEVRSAKSPIVTLSVASGEEDIIPETLLSAESLSIWSWVIGCLGGLLLVAALVWWGFLQSPRRSGQAGLSRLLDILPTGGRNRPPRHSPPTDNPDPAASGARRRVAIQPGFALDVLHCESDVYSPIGFSGKELRIGRSSSQADIVFDQDITMSRVHARLLSEDNSYRLYDAGSTSGTLINQHLVPEYGTLLMNGDEIQLGNVRLRFRIVEPV